MVHYQRRTLPGNLLQGPHVVSVTNSAETLAELLQALDADWLATHDYSVGDVVSPTVPNGFKYEAIADTGSSDAGEPAWPTVLGETIVDDGITWECVLTRCVQPGMKVLDIHVDAVDTVWWAEGVATNADAPLAAGWTNIECTPETIDLRTFISGGAVDMQVVQRS